MPNPHLPIDCYFAPEGDGIGVGLPLRLDSDGRVYGGNHGGGTYGGNVGYGLSGSGTGGGVLGNGGFGTRKYHHSTGCVVNVTGDGFGFGDGVVGGASGFGYGHKSGGGPGTGIVAKFIENCPATVSGDGGQKTAYGIGGEEVLVGRLYFRRIV
jgi:hypothetical protein